MVTSTDVTPSGIRLLAAASRLFYRHGINGVGVALIAETAGVTKKTLYDCFGSKDALVAAYLQHMHRSWWAHLERHLVADTSGPRTLVMFDAHFEHPSLEVNRGCAFVNHAAELPLDHEGSRVIRLHKLAVRGRLVELVAQDAPRARSGTAEHIFLIIEGALADRGISRDQDGIHRARQITTDLLTGSRGGRRSVSVSVSLESEADATAECEATGSCGF